MFLFLFSTAVPRTTPKSSVPLLFFIQLHFLHIHPIDLVWGAFCRYVKTILRAKQFIWLPPTGSLTHFYAKGFPRRLVLKKRQKKTFIHKLLTGAFDWVSYLKKAEPISKNCFYVCFRLCFAKGFVAMVKKFNNNLNISQSRRCNMIWSGWNKSVYIKQKHTYCSILSTNHNTW